MEAFRTGDVVKSAGAHDTTTGGVSAARSLEVHAAAPWLLERERKDHARHMRAFNRLKGAGKEQPRRTFPGTSVVDMLAEERALRLLLVLCACLGASPVLFLCFGGQRACLWCVCVCVRVWVCVCVVCGVPARRKSACLEMTPPCLLTVTPFVPLFSAREAQRLNTAPATSAGLTLPFAPPFPDKRSGI